ncbi:MAG: cobyrinate a,c-diamide synthase [Desulfobulbaceae bacterium]|nr:cobyrinate a,c-diamide synthase [Desulfobulbaceae bacterium]
MRGKPACLVAGTKSGGGKTTITLGLLAALQRRGLKVRPFKCGPDFIDPSLHRLVTGKISYNLDPRMCGDTYVRALFNRWGGDGDISVVEGVMGLFDGGTGSGAHLAKLLNLPVLLVLDARSAAESVAAMLHGFETFDPELRIGGVVLNQVGSKRHYELISTAIKEHCRTPLIGSLPREERIAISSRHLGLRMGEEEPLDREQRERLADLLEQHCDLDLLLKSCAERTGDAKPDDYPQVARNGEGIRIGVARDEAFCFYYEDNLELLRQTGAELVFFSPLHDKLPPPDLHGIYLGGGYPELHAEWLSNNRGMRESIFKMAGNGTVIYAECGGFMYLTRGILQDDGRLLPMVGVYPTNARMRPKLSRLGYQHPIMRDTTFFGPSGEQLHGHEFHYSDIEAMEESVPACYELEDGSSEGYQIHNVLAGYIHLHWGSTPRAVENFVSACRRAMKTNDD